MSQSNLLKDLSWQIVSLGCCFFFALSVSAQPSIVSFSPTSGRVGTSVTISGSGFSTTKTNNIVYFGAVKAKVTSATSTALTVTVPAGANFSPITVTTNNLTAYSQFPFIVTFAGDHVINNKSFAANQQFFSGSYVFDAITEDINGDDKTDIVATNYSDATVSIFLNHSSPGSINLGKAVKLITDSKVSGLAAADIDGDGKKDIIVVQDISQKMSVFKNMSYDDNIIFENKVDFSTGVYPVNVAAADINNDGKPDVIVTNNHESSVSVFKNTSHDGAISFASRVDFSVGSSPYGIALQDVNNDGKTDLIIGNQFSNSVSVLVNKSTVSNISFASKKDFIVGTEPYGIAAGDIDGDGKADIITANLTSNNISVLKNTSTGGVVSFATKQDKEVAESPNHIAFGDVDGDGNADIAVSSSNIGMSVLKNKSKVNTISFDEPVKYDVSGSSESVAVADIDGDYKPDVISGVFTNVSVLRSTNFPVITFFNPAKAISGTPIVIRGYNLKSVTEVKFGNTTSLSYNVESDTLITAVVAFGSTGDVSVTTSDGIGSLAGFVYIPPPVITSVTPVTGALNTTITIKGKNFSPVKDSNIVFFGSVQGAVISATDSILKVTVPSGIIYKVITVTCNTLTAFSKTPFSVTFSGGGKPFGDKDFVNKGEFNPTNQPMDFAAADMNKDGKTDILVLNFTTKDTSISLMKNISSGDSINFTLKKDSHVEPYPKRIATGDLNGDGKPDVVVVADGTGYIPSMLVYENTSASDKITLALPVSYPLTYEDYPAALDISDLDGDGKPEIIVAGSVYISIFKNTSLYGNISFAPLMILYGSSSPLDICTADFDGDGKPDIAVSNHPDDLILYRNTSVQGIISFEKLKTLTTGSSPISIAAGDLNGDGLPEIVSANYGNRNISVFKNVSSKGSIAFEKRINYQFKNYVLGAQPYSVSISDMDGDGKTDIVTGNFYSNSVTLFRNICTADSIRFEPNVHYTIADFTSVLSALPADVNNDGKPDIVVLSDENKTITVLSNQIQGVLASQLLNFNGEINGRVVTLQWKMSSGSNITHFEIERSADGIVFSTIGISDNNDFDFIDRQPLNGVNYYRLKIVETNGNTYYSNILPFNLANAIAARLYPNPVKNIMVLDGLNEAEISNVSIADIKGHTLYKQTVQQNTLTINVQQLAVGVYYAIINNGKKSIKLKFIKE